MKRPRRSFTRVATVLYEWLVLYNIYKLHRSSKQPRSAPNSQDRVAYLFKVVEY